MEMLLSFQPPLDWASLLGYFRTHHIPGVETVTNATYERVFQFDTSIGFLRVTHDESKPQLIARVFACHANPVQGIVRNLRRMFDLDCDPIHAAVSFGPQRFLSSLRDTYPGLRIANGWDPFETAVSTILGQLVSTSQARALLGRLVEHLGHRTAHPITGAEVILFPSAEVLAGADLSFLGTTKARMRAIKELSRSVAAGEIDLSSCTEAFVVRKRLLAIPGIGPWSAECISLRALGDRDAFPSTDLILKRATYCQPAMDLGAVRPWRGYAAIYLWRHYSVSLSLKKRKSR